MKNALAWMKANPLTVVSIVVVLLSLGVMGWVMSQGRAFRTDVQERVSRTQGEIDGYINDRVNIPPEQAGAGSERVTNVTITDGAIDELARLNGEINEQYEQVFRRAVQFNRANHERLLPALFTPDAGTNVPIEARDAYRQAFPDMLRPATDDPSEPRLNAGMPPEASRIESQLNQLERQIRSSLRPPGSDNEELDDDELTQLHEEKRQAYIQILRDRARDIHIYAQTDASSEDFPFQVGEWSRLGVRAEPEQHQLWEGQLELWAQQDVVRAIARANRVGDENVSVVNAPVKRLLRLEVIPGYVGLHTLGGVAEAASSSGRSDRNTATAEAGYPMPAGEQRTDRIEGSLPVNFFVGPTGRVSNAMYDVRHVRLRAIVDDQRLPELFRALSAVNFMTVLEVTLQDVNEYEALHEGYVYGTGNAVEAELIIETIWLRDWTSQWMPERVRQYVGLDEPPDPEENQYPGMRDW
ncbi:MAG: hypothetical protein WD534_17290 [Phycisphaeraceae bacterium]